MKVNGLEISTNLIAMMSAMEDITMDDRRLDFYTGTESVSFTLNGINRLQSTLLCLEKDSYVQQSQRYVKNSREMFQTPDIRNAFTLGKTALPEMYENLLERTMDLYDEMTEIKEESKGKKRTTIADYKHGIPIEDARYILPLSAKTNLTVSMSANKFLRIMQMLATYEMFTDICDDMVTLINADLKTNGFEPKFSISNMKTIETKTSPSYEEMEQSVKIIGDLNQVDKIARGVLMSSTENPHTALINDYPTRESREKMILRVAGMGHTSILEQGRFLSRMECSLTCFHQILRHRLVDINLTGMIAPDCAKHIIPNTIKESIFIDQYEELVKEWHEFSMELLRTNNSLAAQMCMLNGDVVQFLYNANLRADIDVMKQRLCMNAQWEIRELYMERKKAILNTPLGFIYRKFALPSCGTIGCQEGNYAHQECKELGRNKKHITCGGSCTCNK